MTTSTALWLTNLTRSAAQAKLPYIDVLVDATNLDFPLAERLAGLHPPAQQDAILRHTPEQEVAQVGPWLLRLDNSNAEHQQLLTDLSNCPRSHQHLLALTSPWDFLELATHLGHCTQAEWNDGQSSGLLRFFDPRLLLAVSEALNPQQSWFHAAVVTWHWRNRDGEAQQLAGHCQRSSELQSPLPVLRLERAQVVHLQAWSLAEHYYRSNDIEPCDYGLNKQETLMRYLVHAQQAASREGILDLDQREQFVDGWLKRNAMGALA
ncbi:DUF4123 domain-containing protein [Pseudomonas sp. L-22-4S-12]|uniref:DUF4123 domain-containing protein n=1 Tax=Pseudomonas sp. L-22-4S-12 TaxID=2610893 RepID=UPI00132C3AE9|nr:DUF4123 domain-containing protein [Pseudomonas sp. L-22-4S-12]